MLTRGWICFILFSKEDVGKILAGHWFWDHHLLCVKPWYLLFYAKEEVLSSLPTWIKLPNLPLELWMNSGLKVIGEVLGTFITSNVSYKSSNHCFVVQILVALDSQWALHESMELVSGDTSYMQPLDYLNVPFWCSQCHRVGHILVDCDFAFRKKFQGNALQASKERTTPLIGNHGAGDPSRFGCPEALISLKILGGRIL
jgi:hypothetical protein